MKVEDLDKIIERLNQIQSVFGYGGFFVIILLVISGFLLYRYLIKSTERIAEEASDKSVAKYQSELSKKMEKELRLFFRDENIRSDLNSHFAKKSIETKLKVWQESYQLYFDYQRTWHFDKTEFDNRITEFDKKFQKNRELIFINSVYLGGYITSRLITMNNGMRNYVRGKYRFFHSASPDRDGNKVEQEYRRSSDKVEEIRPEIEEWINKNLLIDHDSKMWEFTESQLETIKEQKDQEFEDINQIKEK